MKGTDFHANLRESQMPKNRVNLQTSVSRTASHNRSQRRSTGSYSSIKKRRIKSHGSYSDSISAAQKANPTTIFVETLGSGKAQRTKNNLCCNCKNKISIPLKVHQARQRLRDSISRGSRRTSTPEIISIGKVQSSFKLRNPKAVAQEVRDVHNLKKAQRKIANSFGKSKKH